MAIAIGARNCVSWLPSPFSDAESKPQKMEVSIEGIGIFYANSVRLSEQAGQIIVQDAAGVAAADPQIQQRLHLRLVNRVVPSTWKEGGVRSEEEPLGAGDIQRPAKDRLQIEPVVAHPGVAAGCVEI